MTVGEPEYQRSFPLLHEPVGARPHDRVGDGLSGGDDDCRVCEPRGPRLVHHPADSAGGLDHCGIRRVGDRDKAEIAVVVRVVESPARREVPVLQPMDSHHPVTSEGCLQVLGVGLSPGRLIGYGAESI